MNFFFGVCYPLPMATEYRSFCENESDTQSEWDHPAKNGRSGQGQENDPLVSLCRSHLSPFIDCQWLFYKIESYSSRKKRLFQYLLFRKSPCRASSWPDGTSIDLGNSCPGTNAGGTLGGEVRFFEVLRRGSKGGKNIIL